jgi:predicted phosphodiesterase
MFFMMFLLFFCGTVLVSAQNENDNRELPRFAVISDTHFENNIGEGAKVKVPLALKNLLSKTPTLDALFVVGDLTDWGRAEEYEQLVSVFGDRNNVPENIDVYFTLGFNHDVHSDEDCLKNYQTIVGQPLYHYINIKGYPFIAISEWGVKPNARNDDARQFLSEKLADASQKYPGKPIFVFMHIPPLNTCYGSSQNDGWGTDMFSDILNKYPQTIVFTGHSHFPLGDPRSIHQGKFTVINDGSTTYSEIESNVVSIGIHPESNDSVTEGVIVNVMENGDVKIERWDTYRNEEILPRWLVEAPHDGSKFTYKNRNGLPAPAFAQGDNPMVETFAGDSIAVTFRQATDNEVVHHYIVEIKDDKQTVASYRVFSQYYLNSRTPEQFTVCFGSLPAGKKLTAQVTAVDSYNNQSVSIGTRKFQLK